ncbi:Inner membrane protein YedI [compost metagenome]
MPSGLMALIDDVAAIAKLAAASIDDIGAASGKAASKAAGVVVDDAAVTPKYVTGLSPSRELPIIGKIALGSIRNKLLLILPIALLLTAFAPWAITPLLMCGGAYLCFEGAEKVMEMFGGHEAEEQPVSDDPAHLEKTTVAGAVRTDLILSAEIMTIALADVSDAPLTTQAGVLIVVGLAMTVAVYGAVGLLVKLDDIGLHMAKRASKTSRAIGRGLVKGMPGVFSFLTVIGTVAMLWVGGGILLHGTHTLGLAWPAEPVEHLAHAAGGLFGSLGAAVSWTTTALLSALLGLIVGGVLALGLHQTLRLFRRGAH